MLPVYRTAVGFSWRKLEPMTHNVAKPASEVEACANQLTNQPIWSTFSASRSPESEDGMIVPPGPTLPAS